MSTKEVREKELFDSGVLDDEFFIEIVSKKLNITRDDFKIRLVLINPATGENENFVSIVYRAKINIEILASKERKFVDVIIKVMLTNTLEQEEFSLFSREILLYEVLIPSFENIWKERTNKNVKFGPQCLKVTTKPYEIIVLDDLKAEGYEMMNRKIGLDVHQTKLVLSKLAEFHAASAICYLKDGEISKQLDRTHGIDEFLTDDDPYNEAFARTLEEFKKVVREIEGLEKESKIIDLWKPEVMIKSFLISAEPMKCGFKCLNHGDNWVNNLMFKIDENCETISTKLIDFQLSYWGSPIGDLFYFLFTSVEDDVKVDGFDELIEHYHSELSDFLKELSFDGHIPTLSELQSELTDKKEYGLSMMLEVMCIVKYNSNEKFTIDMIMDPNKLNQAIFDRIFRNKSYIKCIKTLLPFLYKRGFLGNPTGN
ncbi:hypothetical protein PVAND_012353 [Polypedilum vanderplanki]|uniref:CHK kinase-like domain-containing protein n=1 Tax=Polypedilum vanderplanki TaxID=319348 RepID=A0A9J6CN57_POLVA|nr:hypothetical protein PVAND_012353 [Polypedilum vanderplanki]